MLRRFAFDFASFRDRLSLGQQIAIVMAVLSLALVVATAVVSASVARQQAETRAEYGMEVVAVNLATRLDTYMAERFRGIRDLANLEPIRDVWVSTPDRMRTVLDQVQDSFPAYTWLGFAAVDGTVIAATDGMLEGASVAERPWFQDGLNGPSVGDVHDAKLLAGLLGDTADGSPFRFVDVAIPVTGPDGTLVGVLGAHMSWTWADEVRDDLLRTLSGSTSLWILRSDGRIVLGPDYDATPFDASVIEAAHTAGHMIFEDSSNGPAALTAIVPAAKADAEHGLGWLVVARRPMAAAYADADRLVGTIAVIGMGLAALGIIIALVMASRLTQPLRQLAEQVDRVGRDPLAANIERENGSRDILSLSASVRSLVRRLGSAEELQVLAQQKFDEDTRNMGERVNALQQMADTDPLTGLLNRRAFVGFSDDAMNHLRRYGRGIGILVVDIDHFKRVNDTFGHAAGDVVIQTVGKLIEGAVRVTDKVARFGGEEFVVLMREIETDGAMITAERIRASVGSITMAVPEQGGINVTVSIGLAMAETTDRDISDVIERADRALYEAKTLGRDQVVADNRSVASAA